MAYFRWAVVARGGALLPLPIENIEPPAGGEATLPPNVGVGAAAPPKLEAGVPNGDPKAGLVGMEVAPKGLAMPADVALLALPNWKVGGDWTAAAWPKLNPAEGAGTAPAPN